VLTNALARIAAGHFSTRDYTADRLRDALELYVLEFPVYRSYVTSAGAAESDLAVIDQSLARARARWGGPDPQIFDFLRDAMTGQLTKQQGYSSARVRNFALKLQQFTGPLMAKALEDTTFYRHHRLLALNEVGGEPDSGALTADEFHRLQKARVEGGDHGLTATATHDTKRGEDARARILALSEIPEDWSAAVRHWREFNKPLRHGPAPTAAHEYMLYQALIGAWEGNSDQQFTERMMAYARKAAREGKQQTSWTNPDEAYEKALTQFVEALLDPGRSSSFLQSFGDFAQRTALLGALNSLSQLTLKALLPGVPDFYQGTELWDFSLVDPDNRRPVNFSVRQNVLVPGPADFSALSSKWQNGELKFALTRRLLEIRQRYGDLFTQGDYTPLAITGPHAAHVIGFSRHFKQQWIIAAVGRHFVKLTDGGRHWPDQVDARFELDRKRHCQNLLTGEVISTDAIMLPMSGQKVPVAMYALSA
jgi:(1->4)-alpha-D-glucan 1-alpha-D-glucosylmutase